MKSSDDPKLRRRRRRGIRRGGGGGGGGDGVDLALKSNNPHLTGGEQIYIYILYIHCIKLYSQMKHTHGPHSRTECTLLLMHAGQEGMRYMPCWCSLGHLHKCLASLPDISRHCHDIGKSSRDPQRKKSSPEELPLHRTPDMLLPRCTHDILHLDPETNLRYNGIAST